MPDTSIAILSDRNTFRESVAQFLQSQGLHQVTGYREGAQLLSALEHQKPRLVLIDMEHGADAPFPMLQEVRRRVPGCTAMILGSALPGTAASHEGASSMKALEFDVPMLKAVAGLAMMAEGSGPSQEAPPQEGQQQRQRWSSLTPRQRDVLGYLSTGSDNLKIAAHLGISERAVKAHVSALLSVFSAENRTELAVIACRAGVRPPVRHLMTPVPLMQLAARTA